MSLSLGTDCSSHCSNNPVRTIPAESSVHQPPGTSVQLDRLNDNTLMATADDFLLFVLVLEVKLELGAEFEIWLSCEGSY